MKYLILLFLLLNSKLKLLGGASVKKQPSSRFIQSKVQNQPSLLSAFLIGLLIGDKSLVINCTQ